MAKKHPDRVVVTQSSKTKADISILYDIYTATILLGCIGSSQKGEYYEINVLVVLLSNLGEINKTEKQLLPAVILMSGGEREIPWGTLIQAVYQLSYFTFLEFHVLML